MTTPMVKVREEDLPPWPEPAGYDDPALAARGAVCTLGFSISLWLGAALVWHVLV